MRTHTRVDSPIGPLTLVAADGVLCGLYLAEHRRAPDPSTHGRADPAGFEELTEGLEGYFAGRVRVFDVPVAAVSTPFQQRVWAALREVPYGTTVTYGELAATVSAPGAGRAVGAANARNPVSIVVPCHRVVGAGGAITGYAGGVVRKRALLDLEAGRPALALV